MKNKNLCSIFIFFFLDNFIFLRKMQNAKKKICGQFSFLSGLKTEMKRNQPENKEEQPVTIQ